MFAGRLMMQLPGLMQAAVDPGVLDSVSVHDLENRKSKRNLEERDVIGSMQF